MSYANTLPRKAAVATLEQIESRDPALHKAKFAFFFLLVFTAVLFGRPTDMIPGLHDVHLAEVVAICACVSYLAAHLQGGLPFTWTTELKIVFALTFFYAAGVPFAFWRTNSLDTLTRDWLKTVIIFFLLTQTVFALDRVRKLLWVIILCEFVATSYSILTQGDVVIQAGVRMTGSTFGFFSGNFTGIAAAVTLPYIAGFLVRSRSTLRSLLLMATFGAVTWMVVLTASRGGMMSVLFSLGLVWFLVLRDSFRARLMGLFFVIAIIAAVAAAPKTFWERIQTLWGTSSYATSDTVASAGYSEYQRKALLRRSIQYTLQHPLFGVGLGNFGIVSGTLTRQAGEWKGTHNTFTQISSEAGIPAFLLYVALLYVATRNLLRISRACGNQPAYAELRVLSRATLVSIYSFMFGAFFAHLAYDYYFFYLAGIGVALHAVMLRSRNGLTPPVENGRPRLRNGSGGRAW